MTHTQQEKTLSDVCLPKGLAAEYPELFTKPQLDWLIKTRHKNGLAETGAVLKISRKIYIHKTRFFEWFMEQKAA